MLIYFPSKVIWECLNCWVDLLHPLKNISNDPSLSTWPDHVPSRDLQLKVWLSNLSFAPCRIEIINEPSLKRFWNLGELKKLFHIPHFCVILTSSSINSLKGLKSSTCQRSDFPSSTHWYNRCNISKDNSMHECPYQHDQNWKNLLHICICWDISKSDRSQRRKCKI